MTNFLMMNAVAAGLGGLVMIVLWRPLLRTLTEICGTRQRGLFWTTYMAVMLVLVPVLCASALAAFVPSDNVHLTYQRAFFVSVLGATVALFSLGRRMWTWILDHQPDEPEARSTSDDTQTPIMETP